MPRCPSQDPLQSMLSGLGFQQGLLKAATAVAAQEQSRKRVLPRLLSADASSG